MLTTVKVKLQFWVEAVLRVAHDFLPVLVVAAAAVVLPLI